MILKTTFLNRALLETTNEHRWATFADTQRVAANDAEPAESDRIETILKNSESGIDWDKVTLENFDNHYTPSTINAKRYLRQA